MRRFTRPLCGMLVLVMMGSMTCAAAFGDVKDEKNRLDDLNKKQQEIQNNNQKLQASKAEAEKFIQEIDAQMTELSIAIYETGQELDATQTKIEKTKKKLKKAKEDIVTQYADMKLRIKYMYENGDTQILDLLLNSGSFTEFLNKAEYITELSQYDRNMLEKMRETKRVIAEAKETLEKEESKLLALQKKQKNKQKELEALSDSKKEELNVYNTEIQSNLSVAKALDNEIEAQEKRIVAAEKESAEAAAQAKEAAEQEKKNQNKEQETNSVIQLPGTSISGGTSTPTHTVTVGGYLWPCPGYTTISSGYGGRGNPFGGGYEFHHGIDIPAPVGTPVVASASGTVILAGYSTSAGNWIKISHGNSVTTVYMHMNALLVSNGQKVNAGQTIGLVGKTGSATGYHLHFGVMYNGSYVDPRTYVGN